MCKMNVLRKVFAILTVCGCWQPRGWSSSYKKIVYTIYTVFIVLIIYSLTISQLLDIIFNVDNQDDFSDNFYMLLAMFVSCCKMNTLLVSRTNIGILMDTLEKHPYAPVNTEEFEIRKRFDKMTQSNTIRYLTLVESTVICITISSLFTKFKDRDLVFRAWLPYDYTSMISYSLTFVHQTIALTAGSLMHVSCDGLLCGLFVHTCCQMEILGYRLKYLKQGDTASLKACAQHHENIYRLAMRINQQFRFTILIQFIVSTLVVCFNLYLLAATNSVTSKFLEIILYTISMLLQIFFYCWFGNEVKVKSLEISDAIYQIDWTHLNVEAKKILLIIMQRATVPIEFTSVYVITMNIESFMSLLKTSYSAYNVLQQAQE